MNRPPWLDEAARLYADGASLRAAGRAVAVSGERVRQVFEAFGIPTRGHGAPESDRFMRLVETIGGHWIWRGGDSFRTDDGFRVAAVASIKIFKGIATEKRAVVTCGISDCVNPDHLATGDSRDGRIVRLFSRVRVRENGCWDFTGGTASNGYGRINSIDYAHRTAWEIMHGPIPDGLHVCHVCDRPPCCNPEHLFLGTVADNMHDRDRKGRDRFGPNAPWRQRLIESQPSA